MNEYGNRLKLQLFGESHAPQIGMCLSGFPTGVAVQQSQLQAFLDRRAPGNSAWASTRKEPDRPVFLSGLQHGITTGETIEAVIENKDARPAEYNTYIPRPGHADYPAAVKYGAIPAGGGRFSGRMTAPLCIAGALCLQYLAQRGIRIGAHVLRIADVSDDAFDPLAPQLTALCDKDFPVLNDAQGTQMRLKIEQAGRRGDSVGGLIECAAVGLPVGLGEHPFDTMEGRIAALAFAVPALKGIEFGSGFHGAALCGSQNNDAFELCGGTVRTVSNRHGGILGGMTSGMPLLFTVAIKPTPSIALPQQSVNLKTMQKTTLQINGRHDMCIVPRAVPVMEAVAAIAICDALLEVETDGAE